ncbi:MAG: Coenzyme F420 hydrogenase/dehydrogenase, beta subunit C-terminal domain, partial [Actinomycetota bacterium]|nr:Coenzyme F420 hydrogenase/dehydrogenase, beta subunit C-terminal domain [Actinomycetota bacterium]
MTDTMSEPAEAISAEGGAKKERWNFQWKELFSEVVTSGLCTGCAGCVIACPHDVIGYKHEPGAYRPFHLEEELGIDNCVHGEKGCTSCTRACPRFRSWEDEANDHLFGREREAGEMSGIYKDILLVRAKDDHVYEIGQDGGLVSAILIWSLENGIIDGALVSMLEGGTGGWKARPGVATNREEVLAGAGSRYTYSANTMAYDEAVERGLSNLALVGMSCQSSIPPIMWHRKVGKVSKPIKLNIGLLCSKSFDDSMFDELFLLKYGLAKEDIVKMNIKGVFQVWMRNGDYHEINLKECHAWTREGCNHCPDFAAEHADISTGGIGNETDWTLTIVRTDLGRAVIDAMITDGVIETRPGDDDPAAIALMHKLAEKSR